MTMEMADRRNKAMEGFDPQKKPPRNKYAFACAILASMTSILLGYDVGVMSGEGIHIQKDLKISNVQLEVVNGIINLAITTAGAFYLFASVAVVSWLFFYTMLPEAQGRTLEEMECLFGRYARWQSVAKVLEMKRTAAGSCNIPDFL